MLALDIPVTKSFADLSREKSAEDLKSVVIASFEKAIDQGLPPYNALAVVLEWAAEESARLRSDASS